MILNNYTELERIDRQLKVLREGWLGAHTTKKSYWLDKINEALDERLIIMKQNS